MAINRLKIVISLLKEISEGTYPTYENYGISKEQFVDILEAMQDKGLIKNFKVIREGNSLFSYILDNVKITIDGMEYLNNNSALVKTYRGLKEVRDWLPF